MKKLFFLIIICLFMVSCGKQADNTVEKFIDNIKNKKIDAAMKYVKNEDVAKNMEIMEISLSMEKIREFQRKGQQV